MDANAAQVLGLAHARRLATSGEGKTVRERHNLSLRDIARPLGISASTLLRWERGERMPHGDAAVAWAEIIGRLER